MSSLMTRLERRGFFYQVSQNDDPLNVTVRYGRVTNAGQAVKKHFDTADDAAAFIDDATQSKLDAGYVVVKSTDPELQKQIKKTDADGDRDQEEPDDKGKVANGHGGSATPKTRSSQQLPSPPPSGRKRTSPSTVSPTPSKKRTRGSRKSPTPSSSDSEAALKPETSSTARVDPVSKVEGKIIMLEGDPVDCMLVTVHPKTQTDLFVIMQLIVLAPPKKPARTRSQLKSYLLWERSGRTGMEGSGISELYGDIDEAVDAFKAKFRKYTGLSFSERENQPVENRYRYIRQDVAWKARIETNDAGIWYYWVSPGYYYADGKPTGWHPYTEDGSKLCEQLWMEHCANPNHHMRIVQSGAWAYSVDLKQLTQTNVQHPDHKERPIRRLSPGQEMDAYEPVGERDADGNLMPGARVSEDLLSGRKQDPGEDAKKQDEDTEMKDVQDEAPKKDVKEETDDSQAKAKPSKGKSGTKPPPKLIGKAKVKQANDDQVKDEEEKEENSKSKATTKPAVTIPVDKEVPKAHLYKVYEDWDCTLNQTCIEDGRNNNKFYRIQVLHEWQADMFLCWTHWGRVGEPGKHQMLGLSKAVEDAQKEFKAKFKAKTGNTWDNRADFKPKKNKYELLEIDHSVDPENASITMKKENGGTATKYQPSKLDKETELLVNMLFDKDVYSDAMKQFDIDVKKMPLGQLSSAQVQRGVDVLDEIRTLINQGTGTTADFQRLSSRFYQVLPHDFGRQRPPVINDMTMLQSRYDMCDVLLDIEKANDMMDEAEHTTESQMKEEELPPNPSDAYYENLKCELELVDQMTEEFQMIAKAFSATKSKWAKTRVANVWRVSRPGDDRFDKNYRSVDNHRLLWHGTNIAVVAPILSSGLRIMPHSGGRVGKGIYLASEHAKSWGYTRGSPSYKLCCMFLCEAALGKPHQILVDDSSLVKAPAGYDSVHAVGNYCPDKYENMKIDGVDVKVPTGEVVQHQQSMTSNFYQDEFLVYNEAQTRLRYILTFRI